MTATDQPEPLDLVWGADKIGAVLGITEGQAKYGLSKGEIPGRKTLGKWVASRTALLRYFAGKDA